MDIAVERLLVKTQTTDWSCGMSFMQPLDSLIKGQTYLLFNRSFDGFKFYNYQIRYATCEELNLEEDYYRFTLLKPDLDTGIPEFLPLSFINNDSITENTTDYGNLWFVIDPV